MEERNCYFLHWCQHSPLLFLPKDLESECLESNPNFTNVLLGKLLNLSMPQCSYPSNGDKRVPSSCACEDQRDNFIMLSIELGTQQILNCWMLLFILNVLTDHCHYHLYQNNILSRPQTLLVIQITSSGWTLDSFILVTSLKSRSASCFWECKLVQPLWRTVWRFL